MTTKQPDLKVASWQTKKRIASYLNFWVWLVQPKTKAGGRSCWLNWLLAVHLIVGILAAILFKNDLPEKARSVVIPFASILIGLTFAWSATALGIISSHEFRKLMKESPQGVRGTANYYQLAIFVVLASALAWGIAGMGPYPVPSWLRPDAAQMISASLLFALTSFAITECWSAINLTRIALLSYVTVREIEDASETSE